MSEYVYMYMYLCVVKLCFFHALSVSPREHCSEKRNNSDSYQSKIKKNVAFVSLHFLSIQYFCVSISFHTYYVEAECDIFCLTLTLWRIVNGLKITITDTHTYTHIYIYPLFSYWSVYTYGMDTSYIFIIVNHFVVIRKAEHEPLTDSNGNHIILMII